MVKKLQAEVLQAVVAESPSAGIDVVVHESIDSTNNWCLQQAKSGKKLPFVCFAEEQTQGRGRRGKDWFMSPCSNIAMTVTWPFVVSHQQLRLLPLSIALAIVDTLESFFIKEVQVKWPNDVFVADKKIAGVLIETQPIKNLSGEARGTAVAIGVGLNYDMSLLDKKLPQAFTLTDLLCEAASQSLDVKPDRMDVASALLKNVVAVCQDYQQVSKYTLDKFRARYDYCREKNVELILDNNDVLSGLAQGVNEGAELLVLIDGQQRVFNSAEVSVKV